MSSQFPSSHEMNGFDALGEAAAPNGDAAENSKCRECQPDVKLVGLLRSKMNKDDDTE